MRLINVRSGLAEHKIQYAEPRIQPAFNDAGLAGAQAATQCPLRHRRRLHHARPGRGEKPAGLETITLTYYREHVEHRFIARIMSKLLAAEGVTLEIQEVDYDEWHRGEAVSDIWLNSANFTLPLDFSLFSHLYEIPLIQHCIARDWQQDAAQWRAGEMNLAVWCQQLLSQQAMVPLIHHWLMIQGQRSMRGLRMNTLGWFDFKSAWFAPPEP